MSVGCRLVSNLLDLVLDAHGGLERWHQVRKLMVYAQLGGELWAWDDQDSVVRHARIELDPHAPHLVFHEDTAREYHDALEASRSSLWNCLAAPFVLTMPGVHTEEIDVWEEAGEEWRRLKAVFPEDLVTDAPEQVYAFNNAGLLRRHDCHAQIGGLAVSASYAADHKQFDGLVIATRRRIVPSDSDGRSRRTPVLMTIDVLGVQVDYLG